VLEERIAGPGHPVAGAAGVARVVDSNMAAGVREVTIRRGHDPREFPLVVAGGAGPNHACAIAAELEMPLVIVPRESSIFCAAGMLMTDLKHDVIKSCVARLAELSREKLLGEAAALEEQGRRLLRAEQVPEDRIRTLVEAELRYVRQYHEVSLPLFPLEDLAERFHAEHHRLYGYALAEEGTPLELINLRVRAIGVTDKPRPHAEKRHGPDPRQARKGERPVWVPEEGGFRPVPVFDGHRLRHGNRIAGPAIVEQRNTTLFASGSFDLVVDRWALPVHRRGREDALPELLGVR
jgi:N-methylhydantoinase A